MPFTWSTPPTRSLGTEQVVWSVVAHTGDELTSTLSQTFQEFDIEPMVVRPFLGDRLPDARSLSGLVILGAPDGSADDITAHLVRERHLLASCVTLDVPVLGICFGAQLLAVALGGSVRRSSHPRSGPGAVRVTSLGRVDPILGGHDVLPVMNWYADEFVVPVGSRVLATDDTGAARAFRYGSAYGLQFHPEIDDDMAGRITFDDPSASAVESMITGRALVTRFLAHAT